MSRSGIDHFLSCKPPLAAELIENADELDKVIDADPWDTEPVLGA